MKPFLLGLLAILSINFTFAAVLYDSSSATPTSVSPSTVSITVGTGSHRVMLISLTTSDIITSPLTLCTVDYNGTTATGLDSHRLSSGGSTAVLATWYVMDPDSGTHNVNISCSSVSYVATVSTYDGANTPYFLEYLTSSYVNTNFSYAGTATEAGYVQSHVNAQSGCGPFTGYGNTYVNIQPEVALAGMTIWRTLVTAGSYNVTTLQTACSQNYRMLNIMIPSYASDAPPSYTDNSSSTIDFGGSVPSNPFDIGSSTLSFYTPSGVPCDISSISFSLTSFVDFGTFNLVQCALEAGKYVLFGPDGFTTGPITTFVNNASSTLPFTVFKFVGAGLYYVNPTTGTLQNLPDGTANIFSVPISASSSVTIDINRSTSTPFFTIPSQIDNVIAVFLWVIFFVVWALLARKILL